MDPQLSDSISSGVDPTQVNLAAEAHGYGENVSGSRILKLQSSDGRLFDVEVSVVRKSEAIRKLLDDLDEGELENLVIPLPSVRAEILNKVIHWAEFHKNDNFNLDFDEPDLHRTFELCEWDASFLKVDQQTLWQIIMAADYLGIKSLQNVACKAVAMSMRGKSPEEMRLMFNLENDLSPEEMEQIRRENDWCEEK